MRSLRQPERDGVHRGSSAGFARAVPLRVSLLFLAPAPPTPSMGGGSLRMFHMLRFLGERFDVDLVAPKLPGAEAAKQLLGGSCRTLTFVPSASRSGWRRPVRVAPYDKDAALDQVVRSHLASGAYSAVQVEKPAMLPYLPSKLSLPVVLDVWAYGATGMRRALRHERGVFRRARNLLRLIRLSAFDACCWPALSHLLVVSEIDRDRCARRRPRTDVVVVPNGVDCSAIRPGQFRNGGAPVLLFTGDMGFAPNVHAALILATEIFPLVRRHYPDVELRLVGRNPDPRLLALADRGIRITGEVPEMLPHLHDATVFVAPHLTGAGTRTKLLEAMAAGLPIVTTRIGIEGIEASPNDEVVLADGRDTMIAAVLRLLADPTERRRLGTAARRLVEQRYDWPRCLAPLEHLHTELLAAGACRC